MRCPPLLVCYVPHPLCPDPALLTARGVNNHPTLCALSPATKLSCATSHRQRSALPLPLACHLPHHLSPPLPSSPASTPCHPLPLQRHPPPPPKRVCVACPPPHHQQHCPHPPTPTWAHGLRAHTEEGRWGWGGGGLTAHQLGQHCEGEGRARREAVRGVSCRPGRPLPPSSPASASVPALCAWGSSTRTHAPHHHPPPLRSPQPPSPPRDGWLGLVACGRAPGGAAPP